MKTIYLACLFIAMAFSSAVRAQTSLEIEGAYVVPGYNDVSVPGDTGSRFSLSDDLQADDTTAWRLRLGYTFAEKHWVALMAAPLTTESSGTLNEGVDFNGTTFSAGTAVDSTFRFDSYRLIYRYQFHQSDRWQIQGGGALKVRDAAIRLEGGGLRAEKKNTGAVPLLSFNVTWTPSERVHVLMDGEALAAPQGRAEDILFAARYNVNPTLALQAGYRILEGGADNDEVYTFSLFHQATVGVLLRF